MNKKIIPSFALAAALLLPTLANAGLFGKDEWEKEDCPKKHSLAWCLADYHGRSDGIFDDTPEKFAEKLKKAGIAADGSSLYNALNTGFGLGGTVGGFLTSGALGGGIFFLNAFMPGPAEQNRRDPYVVFFDERAGRTREQIADDYNAVVLEAIKSAIESFPENITATEVTKVVDKRSIKYYRITTPDADCSDGAKCTIGSAQTAFYMSDEIRQPPAYLNAAPVVSPYRTRLVSIGFAPPQGVNRAILAKAISEKLPSWVYWFIPAGYLGNPFPMFLNQGNAMFFVKPSPESPVPVMPHVAAKATIPDDKPAMQPAAAISGVPAVSQIQCTEN